MRTITCISLVVLLAACVGGCLTTGQIKLHDSFGDGVTHNGDIYTYHVDLNTNSDYVDNKDKILSIDAISIVAVIKNNLQTDLQAEIYISENKELETVEEITDPKNATLVFVSPTVPGNGQLDISWADGFAHIVDEQAIIDQIIGDTADGMFTVYAIGNTTNFDFAYKAEVVVLLTVEL
ncbi:MAG: hypothetical protein JSW50_06115 [Candidatus Latescibacterota bacterium]|nr:MAG: hypothetical protein JSW50_06115 [Candidatus Latescibacterota bacterium]